jgi:hypothetical protein
MAPAIPEHVQPQEQIMATTAKRPGKKMTARRKPAKKVGAKKAGAKKTSAKKAATTARRGVTAKTATRKAAAKRPQAAKAKTGTPASTRSAGNTSAAKKSKLGARKTARSRSKPVPAKKTHRRMSPQARKNLVAKHLREMLEEKNRRAAQTPAWQQIVHHDHPAPLIPPRIPDAEATTPSTEPSPVATGSGNRDRGGN